MNKVYELNRQEVLSMTNENSIMILFSGIPIKSSADAEFPFVVNRNFYHLTGINEPNLVLALSKDKTTLFIEESDEMYEKWIGKKINKEEAYKLSNIDDIKYIKDFKDLDYTKYDYIYLDLEKDQISDNKTISEKFKEKHNLSTIDAYPLIAKSRSIKSDKEVEKIKSALDITNKGLENILRNLKPNTKESVFEAHFDFVLKSENVINAFDTIAASGENACTLHYVTNNEIAKDNDLILFDLGATYDLYCGDISRTYPVNGKFSERQKELYEMVLAANEIVIAAIKPGVTMNELNDLVIKHYESELLRLNVIKDKSEVSNYYYHGVSHSLGLDTHDVGLARDEKLEAGHIITVEPGIYIKEEKIGIRIEDNILVTKDSNINLSSHIIKYVADIEEFMENVKK